MSRCTAPRITSKCWCGSFVGCRKSRKSSREARQYSQRRLTYFHDEDGSLVVKLQLPAESGALLLKALDAALLDVPLPSDDRYQSKCTFSGNVRAPTSMHGLSS